MNLRYIWLRTLLRYRRSIASALLLLLLPGIISIVDCTIIGGGVARAVTPKLQIRNLRRRKTHKPTIRPGEDAEQELGSLDADLTVKAEKEKPFDIDVFLRPKDKRFKKPVTVFMEQTSQIKYEPRVFTVKPGERKTIKATVLKTNSGLAPIVATADNWETYTTIVITGFNARLKTNITEAIDSGVTKSFSINLVDNQGNPVQLDSDVDLTLQGSQIKVKTSEDTAWHDRIVIPLRENSSSSPALSIQSDSLIADKGLISVQLESNGFVVHNADLWIEVKPRWYVPLLMAMLGGVLQGIYKVVKESKNPKNSLLPYGLGAALVGLSTGAISGALAYLMANWGVLGIKVDTTTLQGFVILGFLFSYIGVDVVLKTVTTKEEPPNLQMTTFAEGVPHESV